MVDPCGCPPTVDGDAKGVHHVIVNVKDLARSREFYGWLLPRLGYPGCTDAGSVVGWFGTAGSVSVKQAGARFSPDAFHKDRGGGCEISFSPPHPAPAGTPPRQPAPAPATRPDTP